MKNYTGIAINKSFKPALNSRPAFKYVLLSYYYVINSREEEVIQTLKELHDAGTHIVVDSGAFSYMRKLGRVHKQIDFDDYLEKYISFINRVEDYIDFYFELDIQSVVGQTKYEELRTRLIEGTNIFPVLVWHILDDVKIFKEYVDWILSDPKYNNRIGIGGVAALNASTNREVVRLMKELTIYAASRGIKVHGLGITSKVSRYIPFDSVDSFSFMYDVINNRPVNELGKIVDVYGYYPAWTRQMLVSKLLQYFAEVF